ncbi:hypothetical protein HPB51_002989 [Rhipicephalus microplus]|uniref:Uncharacterized protein n=1 Tax=Rhipicephalus microplus TaxID=6941 RepID=A0A9J6DLJ4_RHIMP|nr:hypothetical protein HPB51_002989 [Rhipicephalus microplus]
MAAEFTVIQACTNWLCSNVLRKIAVVCPESDDNVCKILALKNIRVHGKEHEVAVYAATEGKYVERVTRNVERDVGVAELARLVVNQGNRMVRGVKRIKDTTCVVILFDEEDVPSYIRVGQAIVRCNLYKKQIEVCGKCACGGQRADVCPTALINVSHNCEAKDPKQRDSRQVRGERKNKWNELTKNLRNFSTLQARPSGLSSSGWLEPFAMGRGSARPIIANRSSKEKSEEPYRAQAGPSTQRQLVMVVLTLLRAPALPAEARHPPSAPPDTVCHKYFHCHNPPKWWNEDISESLKDGKLLMLRLTKDLKKKIST